MPCALFRMSLFFCAPAGFQSWGNRHPASRLIIFYFTNTRFFLQNRNFIRKRLKSTNLKDFLRPIWGWEDSAAAITTLGTMTKCSKTKYWNSLYNNLNWVRNPGGWGTPYIGYTGMCRWKGYGFQAIYSGIGLVIIENWSNNNKSFISPVDLHFFRNC